MPKKCASSFGLEPGKGLQLFPLPGNAESKWEAPHTLRALPVHSLGAAASRSLPDRLRGAGAGDTSAELWISVHTSHFSRNWAPDPSLQTPALY